MTDSKQLWSLTQQLIQQPSVTPDDCSCQKILIDYLNPLGFKCQSYPAPPVSNFWATHCAAGLAITELPRPIVAFAGHTDVVPPGEQKDWLFDPFTLTRHQGKLYGRGVADMKAAVAAFSIAAAQFIQKHPQHRGTIALLVTSDEEGNATQGTKHLVETLSAQNQTIDHCIVGEPSCVNALGDTLKNGRRGSLSGRLILHGKQGHIAYPHLAQNPIHTSFPVLQALCQHPWGGKNDFFSETSFQVSNIHAGYGFNNVTPQNLELMFNFRFSPETPAEDLQRRVCQLLEQHQTAYTLEWTLSAQPFFSAPSDLTAAITHAIESHLDITPILSTSGGTSDGRFIQKICPEVIEFGHCNHAIHQVNENISIQDVEPLAQVYATTLEKLLGSN